MPSSLSSISDDALLPEEHVLNVSKMGFAKEYGEKVEKAIEDPSTLTSDELKEMASTLCAKAFEKSTYSYPLSSVMITICDKDANQVFTNALVSCCRVWFNERHILRPDEVPNAQPKKHRWAAYVAFITDFYLNLKSQLRGVQIKENIDDDSDEEIDAVPSAVSETIHLEFADLLYDCSHDIVNILDTTNSPTSETECLLNVLRSVGRHMEKDRPDRMKDLISQLKITFVGPVSVRLPEHCVKSILEIIECAASDWTFNSSQAAYYYPSLS